MVRLPVIDDRTKGSKLLDNPAKPAISKTKYAKISRDTAPKLVVEQLLNMINSGELKPGDSLPAQRELARLLGVGRSSMREAINALAVMGYLDVAQGKGTFIRDDVRPTEISLSRIQGAIRASGLIDLMEIRETIERKSAELAAERANKGQVRKMKNAVRQLDAMKENYDGFLEADMQFHFLVAEATQNSVICRITKLMLEEVAAHHRKLNTARLTRDYHDRSIESAGNILACIEKGDGHAAADWMARHLNEIREELKDVLY